MGFIIDALFRFHQQRTFHCKWFGKDRGDRIRLGHTPDGLYAHERSEADKERVGLKTPDKRNPCASGCQVK